MFYFFCVVVVTRGLERTWGWIVKLLARGPGVMGVGLAEEDRVVQPWSLLVPMAAFRSSLHGIVRSSD